MGFANLDGLIMGIEHGYVHSRWQVMVNCSWGFADDLRCETRVWWDSMKIREAVPTNNTTTFRV
jgi:hypothetical protein